MEDVSNEDVFELIEETSANKPFRQEVILKVMKLNNIKMVWRFIKLFLVKDGELDKKIFITNTIPQITERFEDIESNEVSFNMLL